MSRRFHVLVPFFFAALFFISVLTPSSSSQSTSRSLALNGTTAYMDVPSGGPDACAALPIRSKLFPETGAFVVFRLPSSTPFTYTRNCVPLNTPATARWSLSPTKEL